MQLIIGSAGQNVSPFANTFHNQRYIIIEHFKQLNITVQAKKTVLEPRWMLSRGAFIHASLLKNAPTSVKLRINNLLSQK